MYCVGFQIIQGDQHTNTKRHRQIQGLPKKLFGAPQKGDRKWVAEKSYAESSILCWPSLQRGRVHPALGSPKEKGHILW